MFLAATLHVVIAKHFTNILQICSLRQMHVSMLQADTNRPASAMLKVPFLYI